MTGTAAAKAITIDSQRFPLFFSLNSSCIRRTLPPNRIGWWKARPSPATPLLAIGCLHEPDPRCRVAPV
jgi:hypothetical protein